MVEHTTIAINRLNKGRLDALKRKGETYNDVLVRIINESLSAETKAKLDELRGPSESYDEEIGRILSAGKIDRSELWVSRLLAHKARSRIKFKGEKIVIEDWSGE